MNRRQFISIATLIFAPAINAREPVSSFGILLSQIKSPFTRQNLTQTYSTSRWCNNLRKISSLNSLSQHILNQIKQDYIENKVELIEGIVLSETEVQLYLARESYA